MEFDPARCPRWMKQLTRRDLENHFFQLYIYVQQGLPVRLCALNDNESDFVDRKGNYNEWLLALAYLFLAALLEDNGQDRVELVLPERILRKLLDARNREVPFDSMEDLGWVEVSRRDGACRVIPSCWAHVELGEKCTFFYRPFDWNLIINFGGFRWPNSKEGADVPEPPMVPVSNEVENEIRKILKNVEDYFIQR